MGSSIHAVRSSAVLLLAAGALVAGCSESPTAPPSGEQAPVSAARHVPGPGTTGKATLHPQNRSGVNGRIDFVDDGSTITINGTATGLTPGIPYASLIYDNGSSPGGPLACEPTIFDPSDPGFLLTTMFVGLWTVDGNGNGLLSEVNIVDDETGARVYVPLSKFKTLSIRDLTINGGFGPEAVVACGEEASHGQR
jgi:hypothetical protein